MNNKQTALRAFLIVISLCSIQTVQSENNISQCPQKFSFEDLRAYAYKNSPLIAEIDYKFANELAEATEVEVIANPELQFEQTFTGMHQNGDNDPQSVLSVGQPLKLSDFGAKSKVAALIRKAGDSEKAFKLFELNQKISIQFFSLYAMQKNHELLKAAEQRSAEKIKLIKQAVTKGLLSVGQEKLFEGEKFRLEAERKGLESKIAVLQSELGVATGLNCKILADFKGSFEKIPVIENLKSKAQSSNINQKARLQLSAQLASEKIRLSELDRYSAFTPKLVYQHTNDGADYFGAGVSLSLPFWDQNASGRLIASAEQELSQKHKTYIDNGGLDLQIESLSSAAVAAAEQSEIYATKVVPSFEAALKSEERLYAEGKGDILQVWQVLRASNEVQIQSLTYWIEAAIARLQLSILIGEEI